MHITQPIRFIRHSSSEAEIDDFNRVFMDICENEILKRIKKIWSQYEPNLVFDEETESDSNLRFKISMNDP